MGREWLQKDDMAAGAEPWVLAFFDWTRRSALAALAQLDWVSGQRDARTTGLTT